MNRADERRLEIIHAMPCLACVIGGYVSVCGRTEAHHLVDRGTRRLSGGHQATLPLGAWHHRGEPRQGFTVKQMRDLWGPSMKLESKTFALTYGTQRELLARVDARIELKESA